MTEHLHPDAAVRRRDRRLNLVLALAGGIMLGCAFPPSPFSTLAYVAFIPLFLLFERVRTTGALVRWFYLALLVFHLLTVYWTGGFTNLRDPWMMAAGGALLLFHPLFYVPNILLAHVVRRRRGSTWGISAFVLGWLAIEHLHARTEFAFPWLALGNSQALDLARAQVAEIASVEGLSALILLFNALTFILLIRLAGREWRIRSLYSIGAAGVLVLIYVAPFVWGTIRMKQVEAESGPALRVAVIQPNVDPWDKWGEGFITKWGGYARQLDLHLGKTAELAASRPDLVVWCETAIPFHILHPRYAGSLDALQRSIAKSNVTIFSGLPTAEYFSAADAPVTATRIEGTNEFVQSYNSATTFGPDGSIGPIYRKMLLVPFAERLPYARALRFLIEPLRWGVGISSWGTGRDTVVHRFMTGGGAMASFGGMICYESVFPDFVRQFALHGAEFLVVITNDSWWGNTSGAYQHAAYASLRAIESRRWVVQCANGGISEIVNPSGRVVSRTAMNTACVLTGSIDRRTHLTPYVRWGDILGVMAMGGSVVVLAIALARPTRTEDHS